MATRVNVGSDEFRFQHLFNTALLNDVLEGKFVAEPLDPKRLLTFLKSEADWVSGDANFKKWLILQAESRVNIRICTPESRELVMNFVKRWVDALSAEFLPLRQNTEIDPRFVNSVLLLMESP